MPHFPKPFQRKGRPHWYVQIRGKQINLGPDRDAAFDEYHRLMASPEAPPPPRTTGRGLTVSDAADVYLDHVEATCAPATYAVVKARLQVVCDRFGNQQTDQVQPADVREWLAGRANSDSTKRGYVLALKAAFRFCREEKRLIAHEDHLAKLRAPKSTRRERILAREEVEKLITMASPAFGALLKALAASGARPHVLEALTAGDVNWAAREAVVRSKRRDYLLVVTDTLAEIIRPLCAKYPNGPIFRNTRGEPWNRNSRRLQMARLCRKAGIPAAGAYAFRHTFATDRLAAGDNAAMVAELLNHTDLKMVAKHYGHLAKRRTDVRAAAERAARESAAGPGPVVPPGPAPLG